MLYLDILNQAPLPSPRVARVVIMVGGSAPKRIRVGINHVLAELRYI